jgi:hypothetical protein
MENVENEAKNYTQIEWLEYVKKKIHTYNLTRTGRVLITSDKKIMSFHRPGTRQKIEFKENENRVTEIILSEIITDTRIINS